MEDIREQQLSILLCYKVDDSISGLYPIYHALHIERKFLSC